MRHNIIAILIFVGFIATVFTVGYVVSGDNPAHMGQRQPQYGNLNAAKVERTGVGDHLAVPQEPYRPAGATTVNSSGSYSLITGGSGSGSLYSSSSTLVKTYGGSAGSTGGVVQNSNATARSTGGGAVAASGNGVGAGGTFYAIHNARRAPMLATAPVSEEPMAQEQKDYTLQTVGGDPPDPFMNPVGEIPALLMILLCGLFAAVKTIKRINKT